MLERSVQEQLISELKYAIRRERYSQMRYQESARLARTDELRALLSQLAEEESGHEAKLQKELQRLIAEQA